MYTDENNKKSVMFFNLRKKMCTSCNNNALKNSNSINIVRASQSAVQNGER